MTRPALFLALLYLAHRVNRLVTEVEAWRYEQTAKAKPTGAMIGLDPNQPYNPGRIWSGDANARHVTWSGWAADPGIGAR